MKDNIAEEDKLEKFASVLEEEYGYTREKASAEIDRRLKEYDQKHNKAS